MNKSYAISVSTATAAKRQATSVWNPGPVVCLMFMCDLRDKNLEATDCHFGHKVDFFCFLPHEYTQKRFRYDATGHELLYMQKKVRHLA